jgi:O-antigen ligase
VTLPRVHGRHRATVVTRLLCAYALLLVIIPSNASFRPVGVAGFPAGLLGMGMMGLYVLWVLFGGHDPLAQRYPTRAAFLALWVVTLLSYVGFQFRERPALQISGADRWLLFLGAMTGVALLAAEGLRRLDDVVSVVRALVWGGAVCGFVASVQYWLGRDLASLIGQSLPGFSYDGALSGIQGRGGLNRVPGTMLHPIELGTVSCMVLPLAIALLISDRERRLSRRLVPLLLVAACIPVSVSRSAILAAAVTMVVFVCQLGATRRAAAFVALPFALVGVFVSVPGLIATLSSYFLNSGSDPSVTTRTDDYQLVELLVREAPWFGRGGGTYLPDNMLEILDNSYLKWVIEFGLVGLAVLIVFYMALPVVTAVVARRRATSDQAGLLAAAISASLAGAAVSSVTFDSLAFPGFACVQALLIGLVGALWQIVSPWPGPPLSTPSDIGQRAGRQSKEGEPWTS